MPDKVDPFSGPQWSSEDAEALRNFLRSQAGRRLIFRLRNDRLPVPLAKDGVEASALAAQYIAGYESVIDNIFSYLSRPVDNDAKAEIYPDLDSDAGWEEELQSASFGTAPEKPEAPEVTPAIP